MTKIRLVFAPSCPPNRCRQRGVIMFFTLVTLVILLLAVTGLVRSFGTSLTLAGNIAFKRDLANQGERAMAQAITQFKSGGALVTSSAREANLLDSNYFAAALASDSHGIPLMLINDSIFSGTGGDITDSNTNVTIRYVIDRLCDSAGAFNSSTCVSVKLTNTEGGTGWLARSKVGKENQPVYRISVRVAGPRNTQAYLQSTFTS
jgi:type IV pilus assembly protein PilX